MSRRNTPTAAAAVVMVVVAVAEAVARPVRISLCPAGSGAPKGPAAKRVGGGLGEEDDCVRVAALSISSTALERVESAPHPGVDAEGSSEAFGARIQGCSYIGLRF